MCCTSFFVTCNLIFIFYGVAILTSVGLLMYYGIIDAIIEILSYSNANINILAAMIIILIIGIMMFMVGTLGIIGIILKKSHVLKLYFILLIILISLQIVIWVMYLIIKYKVSDELRQDLRTDLRKHVTPFEDYDLETSWFRIQRQFHCCGVNGYKDYNGSLWALHERNLGVPPSCCLDVENSKNETSLCQKEVLNEQPKGYHYKKVHRKGCFDKVEWFFNSHQFNLLWLVIGLGIFELIWIICMFM